MKRTVLKAHCKSLKARYTLHGDKVEFNTVDFVESQRSLRTHWQRRKDTQRSGESPPYRRQSRIGEKSRPCRSATVDFVADLSPVSATVDFVTSVYRALDNCRNIFHKYDHFQQNM